MPQATTSFTANLNRNQEGTITTISTGRTIPYSFVRGRTYQIKFNIAVSSSSADVTPLIQVGLNKILSPVPSNHCGLKIDLGDYSIPYQNISGVKVSKNGTNAVINFYSQTVTFIADDCYTDIWFNFAQIGNYTTEYNQLIDVRSISVTDVSGASLAIQGNSEFNGSVENTYNVLISGFNINEQFVWSTTGNLEIVGSAVGPTVRVRSSNSSAYNGTLTATLPGCNDFIIKRDFVKCTTTVSSMQSETVTGNGSFSFSIHTPSGIAVPLNEIKSIDWFVSNSNVNASFTTKTNNFAILNVSGWNPSYNNTLTVNAVMTTNCGQQHTFFRQFGGGSGGGLEDS